MKAGTLALSIHKPLYGDTFHVAIVAILRNRALLSEVPCIEDVNFAEMERKRRASEIADRYRVCRLISAVLDCAELFDLTVHEELVVGECWECTRECPLRRSNDTRHCAPQTSMMLLAKR